MKWQRDLPLRLWRLVSLFPSDVHRVSYTSPLRSCYKPIIPIYFHLIPLPSLNHFGHVPPSFPDFSPLVLGQSVKQGCYTFPLLYASISSPSLNHTPLPLSPSCPPFSPFAFLYLLPLPCVYCYSCHVSVLSIHPYPLLQNSSPSPPLHSLCFRFC